MRIFLIILFYFISLSAVTISNFISLQKCDQIVNKKYFKVCYSYDKKAALAVWYNLYANEELLPKIKHRPRFYNEKTIPLRYRAKNIDYYHSGYDRGHMASNWDFAFSKKAQLKTFSLCNIVPQNPFVNRKLWEKAERYERHMSVKLNKVTVINIIKYSYHPKRIGIDKIAVPSGFYKIIFNNKNNFTKCFYYKNSSLGTIHKKLKSHLISCKEVKK